MTEASKIAGALEKISRGLLVENAPMSSFSSMGVGGPADVLWIPTGEKEALEGLEMCDRKGWEKQILGAGTNVIVRDGGIEGLTILIRGAMEQMEIDGARIKAGAGVSLPKLARTAARAGLAGLEFASNIPGTLGGAIITNAGAFGGSIGDVIRSARVRIDGGEIEIWDVQQFEFGYRSSSVPEDALILEVELELVESSADRVMARMKEMENKRKSLQPTGVRSAGCIFKNPTDDSAARLIDAAGLKGRRKGGAVVSDIHAGYIVNTGGATATDVLALMEEVHRAVFDASGVDLMPEVRIIGREMH